MLLSVQTNVRAMAGVGVTPTVLRSIGSLKVTTTSASSAPSTWLFTGIVDTMNGATPAVLNVHGFGTGPGIKSYPSRSKADRIVTSYWVDGANGAAWLSVRTVSPIDHPGVRRIVGTMSQTRLVVLMGSTNVTTMLAVTGTPVVPFAGSVAVM